MYYLYRDLLVFFNYSLIEDSLRYFIYFILSFIWIFYEYLIRKFEYLVHFIQSAFCVCSMWNSVQKIGIVSQIKTLRKNETKIQPFSSCFLVIFHYILIKITIKTVCFLPFFYNLNKNCLFWIIYKKNFPK